MDSELTEDMELSHTERIILHLGEFSEDYSRKWDVPFALCQNGIAEALGVARSWVSRHLMTMKYDGMIEVQMKHILGQPRRRNAYFLTVEGRQAWRLVYDRVESHKAELKSKPKAEPQETVNQSIVRPLPHRDWKWDTIRNCWMRSQSQ